MYSDDETAAAEQAGAIKRQIAQKLAAPIDILVSQGYKATDRRSRVEIIIGSLNPQ